MKTNHLISLSAAALLAGLIVGCSSKPKADPPGKIETLAEAGGSSGYGGQTTIYQVTTTNTVVSVDTAARTIVMRAPDGRTVTYKAGPEIANLAAFKVGDPVKSTVIEEVGVSIAAPNAPLSTTENPVVARQRDNPTLTAMPVTTVKFTAKILSFDYVLRAVALQMSDGTTRIIRVRQAINLGDFNVGDNVTVRMSEAMAIKLEKP